MNGVADADALKGTTLRVYRYLFKARQPEGIRDIQRGLNLSSSSVAEYHVKKLLRSGLIREEGDGYVVDRVVWQNMIRMRRTAIPLSAILAVFLASGLVVMILVLRNAPGEGYVFGAIVILIALMFSLFEAIGAFRQRI